MQCQAFVADQQQLAFSDGRLQVVQVGPEADAARHARHRGVVPRFQSDERRLGHDQLRPPRHGQGRSGEKGHKTGKVRSEGVKCLQGDICKR